MDFVVNVSDSKEPKLKHLRIGEQALILNPVEVDSKAESKDKVYATHVAASIGTLEKIEPNTISNMITADRSSLTDQSMISDADTAEMDGKQTRKYEQVENADEL